MSPTPSTAAGSPPTGTSTWSEFEERFVEEFGRAEYEIARNVIERVAGLLDQPASEEEDRDAG